MRNDRVLVIGAGMLSHYLRPFDPIFASKTPSDCPHFHHLDIRDRGLLEQLMDDIDPSVVINTAVIGNINQCEKDPELAFDINYKAHGNVIEVCNRRDIRLVYVSTSSVFDGGKGNYRETDQTIPGTVYGRTKMMGEELTRRTSQDWAIFRVTGLYGNYQRKPDFISQVIQEFLMGGEFSFWDQIFSPGYGPFVAQAIMGLVEREVGGIWHIAGKEQLSRFMIGEILRDHVGKGIVKRTGTPDWLPKDRSLCIDKLRYELPDLEVPDFREETRKLVERMKQENG